MNDTMTLERCFHPVGQGAFYTERFSFSDKQEEYNIVYDCGTLSGQEHLEEVIDGFIPQDKQINALYISHFHNDHISGIKYLLEHANVKYVFLPFIADKILLLELLVRNAGTRSIPAEIKNFIEQFLLRPVQTIRETGDNRDIQVIFIRRDSESGLTYEDANIPPRSENEIISSNDSGCEIRDSGQSILLNTIVGSTVNQYWCFIPFHLENPQWTNTLIEKLSKLIEELNNKLGIVLPSELKVSDIWQNKQEELKKIFRETVKTSQEQNEHSMVLYSGQCNQEGNEGIRKYQSSFQCPSTIGQCKDICCLRQDECILLQRRLLCVKTLQYLPLTAGCLYTGDYNAEKNWEPLKKQYKTIFDNIGILQVPHHGSKKYYSKLPKKNQLQHIGLQDIGANNGLVQIISCGWSNHYGHPSLEVVKQIINQGKSPIIVTELPCSGIKQEIVIH